MDDADIGKNLMILRGNLAQERLAEQLSALGMKWSQSTVWSVEKGTRPLRLREAAAIARILGTTVDALLGDPGAAALTRQGRALTSAIRSAQDGHDELWRAAERADERAQIVRDLMGADGAEDALPDDWKAQAEVAAQDPVEWLAQGWAQERAVVRRLEELGDGDER